MQFLFLFGAMLVVMLMRVAPPIGVRIEGDPVGRVTLGFAERVRLQRTNVYAIGAVLVLCAATRSIPFLVELVVVVAVLAILAIPARYVVTTKGIALNRTVFRSWKEFRGFATEPSGIRLVPNAGAGRFRMVVNPARQRELAKAIGRFLAPVEGDAASTGTGESSRTKASARLAFLRR